jgi:hypothetical protein
MPSPRLALLALLAFPSASPASDFFERDIRPLLVNRCLSCHAGDKPKGGLRLDTREGVMAGGEGGAVVVPKEPAKSRLLNAVRHAGDLKMPAAKLPDREIAALEEWVKLGVPWPDKVTLAPPNVIAKAAAAHWAFKPVRRPAGDSIDEFISKKLSDSGLSLSPRAGKRTLIRRATFDLHGLPPTPAEIDAFESDTAPDAYEKLLDRLLASPRYGERWGRLWLDVARYADNKGYVFFEDKNYPWAFTYRDWVISAFNRDLPFDRFVLEQIAADQLEGTAATRETAKVAERGSGDQPAPAALGFLTVGGHFMNNTHDIIDDRIDVVTRGLMGITVTCARCHDHKFDPIPTADYYSLYGVFRSSTEPTAPPVWGVDGGARLFKQAELHFHEKRLVAFVTEKHRDLVNGARLRVAEYLLAAHAARNQPPADDFMLLADRGDLNPTMITRWRQYLDDAHKRRDAVWVHWHAFANTPEAEFAATRVEGGNRVVRSMFATPPKSMKDVAERYGRLLARVNSPEVQRDSPSEELRRVLYGPSSPADAPLALDWGFLSLFPDRATQAEYQALIKAVEVSAAKGPPRAMVLVDSPRPFEARVFDRGHPGRPAELVPRQFPKVANPERRPFEKGSGRLELAREILSKSNPLTARVFVNRVWMHHFGKPLVSTPGDFGLRSDPPTHPELLDWLAADFMDGWRVKALHKRIMLSAAYTQASLDTDAGLKADPENRLLWKQNRRRLDFESLHDSLLAVSGSLDATVGGPAVPLFGKRRAVYGYVDRLEFPSLLTTFDVPNPAALSPERTSTTVAPQALFLMNGPFARSAAKRLAANSQATRDPAARLDAIFRTALGRAPSPDERELSLRFVAKGDDRWADLVHGLLMANEFAFVD